MGLRFIFIEWFGASKNEGFIKTSVRRRRRSDYDRNEGSRPKDIDRELVERTEVRVREVSQDE